MKDCHDLRYQRFLRRQCQQWRERQTTPCEAEHLQGFAELWSVCAQACRAAPDVHAAVARGVDEADAGDAWRWLDAYAADYPRQLAAPPEPVEPAGVPVLLIPWPVEAAQMWLEAHTRASREAPTRLLAEWLVSHPDGYVQTLIRTGVIDASELGVQRQCE